LISPRRFVRQTDKDEETDTALLQAVAEGDKAAFRQLYDRYYSRVYGFAHRLVQRSDRADEVTNDSMLAIWRGAGSFQGWAKASSWIYGIVYRVAKKSHRFFRFELRQVDITEGDFVADETVAPIEVLFERRRVIAALTRLPENLRVVVELTYYDGMSCAEIAQIVRCPQGTVKSRMSRARAILRDELAEGSHQ
jgi:RNA polymerase sigma factor (sigma-70 family)